MLCGNERCAAWNKHQLFSVAGKMEDVKRGEGNDVAWIVFFLFKIMIMSDFRRNILGRQISTLDSFLFC